MTYTQITVVAALCAVAWGMVTRAMPAHHRPRRPRRATRNAGRVLAVSLALIAGSHAHADAAQPTARDAKRWAQNWCKVQPGFSRAHVRKLMGRATERHSDREKWSGFGYQLLAFYDEDNRVRQLDINELVTRGKQRARLRCDGLRTADNEGG